MIIQVGDVSFKLLTRTVLEVSIQPGVDKLYHFCMRDVFFPVTEENLDDMELLDPFLANESEGTRIMVTFNWIG